MQQKPKESAVWMSLKMMSSAIEIYEGSARESVGIGSGDLDYLIAKLPATADYGFKNMLLISKIR